MNNVAGLRGFAAFKASEPAKAMFRKLGLSEYLEAAESWRGLRALIVEFNGCDKGRFVELVRQCDGVASSGERVLLHAICYACDFAWLADELSIVVRLGQHGDKRSADDGETPELRVTSGPWQRMDSASGEWCRAVAACIAAGA